jgi:hypothetical protein
MQALLNAAPLVEGLTALETLLAHPPTDDSLLELVTQTARVPLTPPTGERARAWLTELTTHLHRELQENLLPYQPLRARLTPTPAEDPRFPCDLYLYPTALPAPENWQAIWEKDKHLFYATFLRAWDRKTCLTCQTPTIHGQGETKWVHFISVGGSPKKREGWGMYIPHPSLFFGRFNSFETHPGRNQIHPRNRSDPVQHRDLLR